MEFLQRREKWTTFEGVKRILKELPGALKKEIYMRGVWGGSVG